MTKEELFLALGESYSDFVLLGGEDQSLILISIESKALLREIIAKKVKSGSPPSIVLSLFDQIVKRQRLNDPNFAEDEGHKKDREWVESVIKEFLLIYRLNPHYDEKEQPLKETLNRLIAAFNS